MSGNERVAVLEQRVKELEAHEERQRNWKMRYMGWLISPSIMLFIAGLTMYSHIQRLEYVVEEQKAKITRISNELGEIYDTISRHHETS